MIGEAAPRIEQTRWTRYSVWGDRKHWELSLGRFSLVRWCPGSPCHLPGSPRGNNTHWIRLRIYRRAGAARFDT